MSREPINPPPPPPPPEAAEGGARRPWRKPRLRLVEFTITKGVPDNRAVNTYTEWPPGSHYDPNLS